MSRFASNPHSHTSKQNLTGSSKGHQSTTNPTESMLGDTRVAGTSPSSEFHLAGFQDTFSQKRKREMVEEKPPQEAQEFPESEEEEKEEPLKPKPGKKTRGRVKIHMEYIPNKLRRYTTFSKRKSGMMKKVIRSVSLLNLLQVLRVCEKCITYSFSFLTGLRIKYFDWNSSNVARGFRDRTRIHLRHSETSANDYLRHRKGLDPDLS